MTCRWTVAKIVLFGNLRWPPSCLCSLYFPATVLFTCIKSWFFRHHLANFHQISHWSYCWNVIDSLFKWSRSIDCQAHIFFKTKNCSNDGLFISCDDRTGKNVAYHLHICSGYVTQVSEPWPVGLLSIFPWYLIEIYTKFRNGCLVGGFAIPSDGYFLPLFPLLYGIFKWKFVYPASILRKSTSGRHRPVSYPDGPMTARYRFT